MDSITQFVLGAGVGAAVFGRHVGPRKAVLIGGVLGTAPDLDVIIRFDDAVDNFILHRGPSHSLIVQAVAAPLFGEALVRLFRDLRDKRLLTYVGVYLIFATHAVLDAMTVYGTRLFWPLSEEPVGIGSIFIVDPIYTLPLLVITVWALFLRRWTARYATAVAVCLGLSTAYLGWGLTAQQIVQARAERILDDAGLRTERMIAIPTPFNSIYWKAIAIVGDRYLNLYLPVAGPPERAIAYNHPRGNGLLGCLADSEAVQKLAWFSRGFYRIDRRDDTIMVSDLRMGLTPSYVFQFVVAEENGGALREVPPRHVPGRRPAPGDWPWLFGNMAGDALVRPAEQQAVIPIQTLPQVAAASGVTTAC